MNISSSLIVHSGVMLQSSSPVHETSSRQDKHATDSLQGQIEAQKEQSLDYQIVHSLLMTKSHTATASRPNKTPPRAEKTENHLTASPLAMPASQTVVQGRAVRLQTEQAQLTIQGGTSAPPVQQADPLVLDMQGNGFQTTGVEKGVQFDINADGVLDKTSFVAADDRFLVYDKNANGIIDDGRELFGDQNGARNGFEELRKYDVNQDNKINRDDAVFDALQLMDQNRRLSRLKDAGVTEIDLAERQSAVSLNTYDRLAQQGVFTRSDGTQSGTADILLGFTENV